MWALQPGEGKKAQASCFLGPSERETKESGLSRHRACGHWGSEMGCGMLCYSTHFISFLLRTAF